MLIFVQTPAGLKSLDVSPSLSVAELTTELAAPSLSFAGRPLRTSFLLSDYGVTAGSTISTVESLDGGKKKKKAYTTPKKKKHVHRKEKLAVLKIYKVDSAQKVSRTRKTCATCGQGVFMAKHKNRFYCGKCHLTVAFK